MKKLIIILLSVFMIVGIKPLNAQIQSNIDYDFYPRQNQEDDYHNLYKTDSTFSMLFNDLFAEDKYVEVDGYRTKLFKEFISNQEALNRLRLSSNSLLDLIQKEYSLSTLSEENWELYYAYVIHTPDIFGEKIEFFYDEYTVLERFFDIFENKSKNLKIESLCINKQLTAIEKLDLYYLLPFDSAFVQINQANYAVQVNSSTLNLTAEKSYADNYALINAPIARYYSFITSDCTNFMSQILEAGGLPQEVTNSNSTGWWHKVVVSGTVSSPSFTHTHSYSWTYADTFVRHFGALGTYTSHYLFSQSLKIGSYIAFDSDNDGDWDHMGFVLNKDVYNTSLGYYNYYVAQHTTNYKKWVSEGSNHWEEKGKWCRVIR